MTQTYDVVVVGGGAAGLSGALMLARARRRVLVVDAGAPRNAPAEAVHALLGHDGVPPGELLARGRAEVGRYGGEVRTGEVVAARVEGDGFRVSLADGEDLWARRLLVTTGLVDELPDLPGVAERWGRDVVHCPYCHGWEVADRALGVLMTGPMSLHQALLFRQWSADVVLFTRGHAVPAEVREQLAARDVAVVETDVTGLVVTDDRLSGVRLADDTVVAREVAVVATRMVARGDVLADLGLEVAEHPSGMGVHVPTDATGRTAVPGVWAAGNVTDLAAQVGMAAAQGAFAAAQVNADLVTAETAAAVAARRR